MRTSRAPSSFHRILYCFVAALTCLAATQAFAETSTPVIVELFTSEGCSSCPPADVLLRTLDATQPVGGVHLIVLGEHVDYWDGLGWKDTFSSHAFTVRQTVYADRLHLASPYTPQMVVDGSFEVLGSDGKRANEAFEKARALPKVDVRISAARFDSGKVKAHIETGALPPGAEVFAALALEHAQSQVLRGENGGHRLEHVAVVTNLSRVGQIARSEAFAKDISLGGIQPNQTYRLIAFIQQRKQGSILGAAMAEVQK
ncbi:MAG TPA: DUF1223 domain-containing protein [Terriglobales bacterium]